MYKKHKLSANNSNTNKKTNNNEDNLKVHTYGQATLNEGTNKTTAVGNGPCGASCVIFLWNVLFCCYFFFCCCLLLVLQSKTMPPPSSQQPYCYDQRQSLICMHYENIAKSKEKSYTDVRVVMVNF